MEKRRRVERDSRQSRSKQFCQEGNDYNSSLRTRSILVTSRRRENDRDITRNECSYSARSTASSRLPQDEYVQRWLAQITPEVDVPSNAGLGSRRGNGRVHLQSLSISVFL
jgi:hypothetical protein